MSGLFERGPLMIKRSGRLLERLRYPPVVAVAGVAIFQFSTGEVYAVRFFFFIKGIIIDGRRTGRPVKTAAT